MCLAFPGRVINIEGLKAIVEYPGEVKQALIGVEDVKVGNMVLVQMGIIIQVISASQADKSAKAWKEI